MLLATHAPPAARAPRDFKLVAETVAFRGKAHGIPRLGQALQFLLNAHEITANAEHGDGRFVRPVEVLGSDAH
ncbi:MAG: hypothetical protein LAO22_01570 [Acidobacteriia bacterium]|nr:hypothetical protein [Terriglobia bacterium]